MLFSSEINPTKRENDEPHVDEQQIRQIVMCH